MLAKGQPSDDCRAALWMLSNTFQMMEKLTWSATECEKHLTKGPHKARQTSSGMIDGICQQKSIMDNIASLKVKKNP